MYIVKSPVLFLIFNRPEETNIVFEEIKKAKPGKLYIAADGPRNDNDKILCEKVRDIIKRIDWECEYKLLFRETNLGCKTAVSSAITWFFENENEGIILEDDIKVANDFFRFMDEMLSYHRDDCRIRHITGHNHQRGIKRGNSSYYFSRWTGVWGWATWKRVWNDYDVSLNLLNEVIERNLLDSMTYNKMLVRNIEIALIAVREGKVDTWDIQLFFSNFVNNGLCVIPNVNLLTNIGFNRNATHTINFSKMHAENHIGKLDSKIEHPLIYVPDINADTLSLLNDDSSSVLRKMKYKIKSIFNNG